jgi:hypothetical protein
MLRNGQNIRIVVVTACIALLTGAVITVLVGPFTGLWLVAHSAMVFVPMLVAVHRCLHPNARGRCATWIRSLAGSAR